MEEYCNGHYTGERALFRKRDCLVKDSLFDDGESPLKEGRNLIVDHVVFGWKYPLWYGKGHQVRNCTFLEMARSGIWYTEDSLFEDCDIIAPKEFRQCRNLHLTNLVFHNAQETLWECKNIKMKNIRAKGDYFGMNSDDLEIMNLHLDGNYCFDGSKRVKIKDSILDSKDAFWNCEDILIENCTIKGEYFGWNSKNVKLVNCHIESHQGFCYMDHVTLIDCTIDNSDLIFEYCTDIDASIHSKLESVKNPVSGRIESEGIESLIQDDETIDTSKVEIIRNAI